MKFEIQKKALQAYARLSGRTGALVDAKDLGNALGISPATAPLCNGFFMDSHWIERKSKGKYVATKALLDYYQEFGLSGDDPTAPLRDAALDTWYWQVVEPRLSMTPVARNEIVYALSKAADAQPEHRPQVENLITWLEYIGLIEINGDMIEPTYTVREASEPDDPDGTQPAKNEPEKRAADVTQNPSDRALQKSTNQPGASGPPALLTLGWDVTVTADDLAKLSPEQITALFEAVGKVVAILKPLQR